jgi:hypothetical protein
MMLNPRLTRFCEAAALSQNHAVEDLMRSDQTQKQSTVQARLGICLVATLFAGITGVGCGSSSSGNKADGAATGTGGTTSGSGGSVGTDGGSGGVKTDGGSKSDGVIANVSGLGAPCQADTNCTAGLKCLTATGTNFMGGGAPNGYCSLPCMSDNDCGASGSCLNIGTDAAPVGGCLLKCTANTDDPNKCNARPDVACVGLMDNTGAAVGAACLPVCSQDKDCPAGRKCDDATAACVDMPTAGKELGSHCTYSPNSMGPGECAGACLGLGGTAASTTPIASFCTRTCVAFQLDNCNWVGAGTSLATGGPHGVCFPLDQNGTAGDLGICFPLCDTAADCADQSDPMLTCDLSGMAQIGHGVCQWGVASTDGGVTDGAAGQ